MRRPTRKSIAIAAGAVLLLGTAGVAYAFWTAGGSGAGTATTGASGTITVNQTAVITDLRPGGAAQTLSGNFTNTSTSGSPVHVNADSVSVSFAATSPVTGAGTAGLGCSTADYTLAGTLTNAAQDITTGEANGTWTGATIQFNNTTANQDDCKGATVNLVYTLTAP